MRHEFLSHLAADKEKIRIGLSMYAAGLRHTGTVVKDHSQEFWETEYGPCVPLGLLLLGAVIIGTKNQAVEIQKEPPAIIEHLEECTNTYPTGEQICATPEVVKPFEMQPY